MQPVVEKAREYLSRSIETLGGEGATTLAPAEAHIFRRNLDKGLRGSLGQIDPTGKLGKAAEMGLRRLVDDELGRTMQAVDLGSEWAAANARYGDLAAAERLAKAGAVNALTAPGWNVGPVEVRSPLVLKPGGAIGLRSPVWPTAGARAEALYRLSQVGGPTAGEAAMSVARSGAALAGGSGQEDEMAGLAEMLMEDDRVRRLTDMMRARGQRAR
jgi:hypothetical protein